MVMPTKDEVANRLAEAHYNIEAGISHIYRVTSAGTVELQPNEPIKLLEINVNTVPSGVMPLSFGPAPASGILFPSVVMEVTPDEFSRIQKNELVLPNGWRISQLLPKPQRLKSPLTNQTSDE